MKMVGVPKVSPTVSSCPIVKRTPSNFANGEVVIDRCYHPTTHTLMRFHIDVKLIRLNLADAMAIMRILGRIPSPTRREPAPLSACLRGGVHAIIGHVSLRCCLDHRHDAGLHRLGQLRLGGHEDGQVRGYCRCWWATDGKRRGRLAVSRLVICPWGKGKRALKTVERLRHYVGSNPTPPLDPDDRNATW